MLFIMNQCLKNERQKFYKFVISCFTTLLDDLTWLKILFLPLLIYPTVDFPFQAEFLP